MTIRTMHFAAIVIAMLAMAAPLRAQDIKAGKYGEASKILKELKYTDPFTELPMLLNKQHVLLPTTLFKLL